MLPDVRQTTRCFALTFTVVSHTPMPQYITRLLIKLLPKGVVFSFLLDPQYAEWTMDRHGMGLGLADQGGG